MKELELALARQALVEYVQAYQKGGNAALAEYHDKKKPIRKPIKPGAKRPTEWPNVTLIRPGASGRPGEEIRFEGGKIHDVNFGTYELARFSQMPEIKTVFVQNDSLSPKGGGEPAIINMGAVVANAIFDATGGRVFRMPMTPERVLEAIERG